MAIKKGWKIAWIALGSLLGLLVLVVVVAMWLIFTPSKLTKIVNSVAGNFITCDATFGNVDLTLLSTFPNAGLKIDSVTIINPMDANGDSTFIANDTLAYIGSLTVGIDVKAFLKENKVIVHEVLLDDVHANLLINNDGTTNFDIFPKSNDTEEDTSAGEMPGVIDLKKIKVENLCATFHDYRDDMHAEVQGLAIGLKGELLSTDGAQDIDAALKLEVERILFSQGGQMRAAAEALEAKVDARKDGEKVDADARIGCHKVELEQKDSVGNTALAAGLDNLMLKFKGNGDMDLARCEMSLGVDKGSLDVGGTAMVNSVLRESKKDLLSIDMPDVAVSLNKMEVSLGESKMKLDDYALAFSGQCALPSDSTPLKVDLAVVTDGMWQVKLLLDIVPAQYVSFRKGMDLDGKVGFNLAATGTLTDSTMPGIGGTVTLADGRFHAPSMLPYKISKVKGKLQLELNPDGRKESHVAIESLAAHTQNTDLSVKGRVDDLLGDMRVDANVKGTLPLEDVLPMVPKEVKLNAKGDASVDLRANFRMSQLQKGAFDKMKASGTVQMKKVVVDYDSIHVESPTLGIALQLPAKEHGGKMGEAHIVGGGIEVTMGSGLMASVDKPDISVGINNLLKEQVSASFDVKVGATSARMDSMNVGLGDLSLSGSVRLDSMQRELLKQYNPRFAIAAHGVQVDMAQLPDRAILHSIDVDYRPERMDIRTAKVKLGNSDLELYGNVDNFEDWMENRAMLRGDLNLTSDFVDVDQLMDLFSGMGTDEDTLHALRAADTVPADANPFIVPRNVNVTLHTHVKRSLAFGNDLHDVAGALTVNDGRVVFDQIGFVCKAATMQLTALYRSPRPGHLFAAIDFHLLDIEIDELIDMIPAVDTLVPMLSAFDGSANFHLAGESYLDAYYRPKLSTTKGAAAISGENLVVMDDKNISTIAKLMHLKSWKDKDNKIKIDSLSVEMVTMDEGHGLEIELYPFLLNMGSYQICVSGVQGVNKDCSYHVELLKNPLLAKVGVDVRGSILSPKISLGKVLYSDIFKPKRYGVAEKKAMEVKKRVREALEANVR